MKIMSRARQADIWRTPSIPYLRQPLVGDISQFLLCLFAAAKLSLSLQNQNELMCLADQFHILITYRHVEVQPSILQSPGGSPDEHKAKSLLWEPLLELHVQDNGVAESPRSHGVGHRVPEDGRDPRVGLGPLTHQAPVAVGIVQAALAHESRRHIPNHIGHHGNVGGIHTLVSDEAVPVVANSLVWEAGAGIQDQDAAVHGDDLAFPAHGDPIVLGLVGQDALEVGFGARRGQERPTGWDGRPQRPVEIGRDCQGDGPDLTLLRQV